MTEQEWLSCIDPEIMLNFLRGRASDRKLQLFACACCRRILYLLIDERSRKAIDVGELFADGQIHEEELIAARAAAQTAHFEIAEIFSSAANAAACALFTVASTGILAYAAANRAAACRGSEKESEQKEQGVLFREIIGNPFRHLAVIPSWLVWNNGTVVKLAQGIYDERAFDRLPILADALEEAGCTNADMLNHCRQPGEHVRGCWVVDLLLGKS